MYTGKRLSTADRQRIVRAHAEGVQTAALAREYGVSRWTIYRLVQRYEETGSVELDFDRCGRKTKLTQYQLNAIRAALAADPALRMQELHHRLHLPCTLRTLYAVVQKLGIEREETPRGRLKKKTPPEETPSLPVWKGRAYLWKEL